MAESKYVQKQTSTKAGGKQSHGDSEKKTRRCKVPGCSVVLSTYNKTDFCARHAHFAPIARFRAS
jgi:hypothetical protein